HKAAVLHGERTRGQRRQALEGFKKGQFRCLVATDLASRGLDVEDVGHVINFDLPYSSADYVHRIGRTARAGASGRASSFVTARDEEAVRAIERIIRMPIPRAAVPRGEPVFAEELERLLERRGEFERLPPEREEARRGTVKAKGRPPIRRGQAPSGARGEGRVAREASRTDRTRGRTGAPGRATAGKTRPGPAEGQRQSDRRGTARPGDKGGARRSGSAGGRGAVRRSGPAGGKGGVRRSGSAGGKGGVRRSGSAGGRSAERRGGPKGGVGRPPRGGGVGRRSR
ncbi:MAG: ATP-dependent helicase, partial [Myxococcaceae bacterium]|nr:ATP-dependent helicase [Myxococcaceae bacterium]